ncbi:hypothetical protein G6F43_000928 [Rhizopus delemar]|nr:hypothetical protein G6F43_000928 [Rhizopus delemar]
MVSNTKVIFSKVPTTYPEAGEHMKVERSEIDLNADIPQGSVLVKVLCLSVDPYMRGRMRDESKKSYSAAFPLGQPMNGHAMGEVLKSSNDKFKVGDLVYGMLPFVEYAVIPEQFTSYIEVRNEAKSSGLPLTNYIGVLGMPGMTAYVGLIKFGKPKKGETLYVSAASGAVGQLVGQIGKILGLYVVGSAGSDEKVEYLKEIGFDAAFNYKTKDSAEALKELCPKGIDIYFENVGGKMLEDVIDNANTFARIVCCGMISQYNREKPEPVHNLIQIVAKSLELRGFIVSNSPEMEEPFRKEMTEWLQSGQIKYRETIAEGIESTPEALIDVLKGKNFGKQVVKVAELYIASLTDKLGRIEDLLAKIANDKQDNFDTGSSNSQEDTSKHVSNLQEEGNGKDAIEEKNNNSHATRRTFQTAIEKRKFRDAFNRFFHPAGIQMQTRENSQILHVRKAETIDLDTNIDAVTDAIAAGLINPDEPINCIEDWIWKIAGIDKDLSDRLLKVYFAYIYPSTPVINKTAFLQEYRRIRPQFPFAFLLLSIYLAALKYIAVCQRFGDADSLNNNESWNIPRDLAERLNTRFQKYRKYRYIPTLSVVQATIIGELQPFNFDRWTAGWILSYSSVRKCQDLGYHRSSEKLDISQEEKETRRRVWWYAYMQDCWYSAETGKPLTIFDGDFDEMYPSEDASWDEIMDIMTETDQHLPRFPSLDEESANKCKSKTVPFYQPLIQMIRLSRILVMVLQNLYTPQGKTYCAEHGSDAIVGYLDTELSKWRTALPPLLDISSVDRWSTDGVKFDVLLAMPGLISISYYTLLILLHRPFIRQDTDNTKTKLSSQTSLAICTSAAARIIEITDGMNYRDFLWGFSLYSTITATLIHVFNTRSSDKTTAKAAKSKLVRALAVIDKLNLLWPGKDGMENLLRKRILSSKLCVEDPEFAEQLKSQQQVEHSLQSKIPGLINKDNQENISAANEPDQTLKSYWLPEKKEEEHESTTFTKDYNWLDQLYLPSQQAPNENNYLMPNSVTGNNNMQHLIDMNDLYSIRQFGFNTTSHNPMFSQAQPLPSFNNANMQIPFDATSNVQNVSAFNQHTEFPLFNSNMPFPYVPSFGDQSIIFNSDTEAATNYLNLGTIPSRNISTDPLLFQNSEGITTNSFWGVPNDMNTEDWYAFLAQNKLQ